MSMGREFLADYAWEIEKAMNYEEDIWNKAQDRVWETKDGKLIPVEKMTTEHIHNAIAFIKRNWDTEIYQPWIDVFNEELKRRQPFITQKDNENTWIKLNNKNYFNCYRLACPKCKHVYIMPKLWGIWKGCPTCWTKLKSPKGVKND